ncbi:MAG: DUF4136 domain-containing protein [Ketobacteraceae bacterium]|nr:DUF4136 domain-containing protein [Ketobacteraceae bacterium]
MTAESFTAENFRKKFVRAFTGWLIVLLACACSSNPVSYDYDPSVDFIAFKSYRWLVKDHSGREDPRIENDLLDQRIRRSINQVLQNRNYIRREQGEGPVDFLVTYQVGIEKRTDVDKIRTGIGFGYRFMDLGFGTETIIREYDEMTLYIDMIDPESRKLIWRGMRTYRYQKGGTVAERDARVQQIVSEILKGFPPTKASR